MILFNIQTTFSFGTITYLMDYSAYKRKQNKSHGCCSFYFAAVAVADARSVYAVTVVGVTTSSMT